MFSLCYSCFFPNFFFKGGTFVQVALGSGHCLPFYLSIELHVQAKMNYEGLDHIWSWRPPVSCGLYHLHKLKCPLQIEASDEYKNELV